MRNFDLIVIRSLIRNNGSILYYYLYGGIIRNRDIGGQKRLVDPKKLEISLEREHLLTLF